MLGSRKQLGVAAGGSGECDAVKGFSCGAFVGLAEGNLGFHLETSPPSGSDRNIVVEKPKGTHLLEPNCSVTPLISVDR